MYIYNGIHVFCRCMATVPTHFLKPSKGLSNNTDKIKIGNCDHGPFQYNVTNDPHNKNNMVIKFLSTVLTKH